MGVAATVSNWGPPPLKKIGHGSSLLRNCCLENKFQGQVIPTLHYIQKYNNLGSTLIDFEILVDPEDSPI